MIRSILSSQEVAGRGTRILKPRVCPALPYKINKGEDSPGSHALCLSSGVLVCKTGVLLGLSVAGASRWTA